MQPFGASAGTPGAFGAAVTPTFGAPTFAPAAGGFGAPQGGAAGGFGGSFGAAGTPLPLLVLKDRKRLEEFAPHPIRDARGKHARACTETRCVRYEEAPRLARECTGGDGSLLRS